MTKAAERRRAERVRSRRMDQAKQRLSESAVLATRPVAPITARRLPSTTAKQITMSLDGSLGQEKHTCRAQPKSADFGQRWTNAPHYLGQSEMQP